LLSWPFGRGFTQKNKYLEIVKEYEEQLENGTIEQVNKALEDLEIEPLNIAQLETIQENNNI